MTARMTSMGSPGGSRVAVSWRVVAALGGALWVGGFLGCARGPELTTRTLEHDGLTRTYHLLPVEAEGPRPLVVALHGGGGQGAKFDNSTRNQVSREARARGWRVVFPEGVAKGWNDGRPIHTAKDSERAGVDDVGFLAALIDRLVAEGAVDARRVYMMGISNGGFMTQRFALRDRTRIAAGAAVTAQVAEVWRAESAPAGISMLWMNGTADPLVPYAGGQVTVFGKERGAIMATDASVDWWAAPLACGAAHEAPLPDRDPDDETRAVRAIRACAGGVELVRYRIEGGGHTWPGGQQYLPQFMIGRVSAELDGTQAIFDFFARHRRPAP